jgi:hypothetical protein
MKKFFVIYRVPVATMEEWRKNTSPEEMKAQGEKLGKDMMAWSAAHASSLVDKGQPLGKTKTVTKSGVMDSKNDLNYYCIIQAESHEAAAKMFADNPHILTIPDSSVDIMDIPHMGM